MSRLRSSCLDLVLTPWPIRDIYSMGKAIHAWPPGLDSAMRHSPLTNVHHAAQSTHPKCDPPDVTYLGASVILLPVIATRQPVLLDCGIHLTIEVSRVLA